MKASVIVFPASNCDRDAAVAIRQAIGANPTMAEPTMANPTMVWHGDTSLPPTDLVILPGGFSYGDYLRSGAMAARSPIMRDIIAKAKAGLPVIGICNGFQVLTEAGLLPGVLMRNANLKFVCKDTPLRIENTETIYTKQYEQGDVITVPVAHHDGNYFADRDTLDRLEGENRVAFRYIDNPNGSARNIAGILNEQGNVLGMMPHPERVVEPLHGGLDGKPLFNSLVEALS